MDTHDYNYDMDWFEPKSKKCRFCKENSFSKKNKDNYLACLYLVLDHTNLVVYRKVEYKEIRIWLPRCKKCKRIHSTMNIISHFSIVLSIGLSFLIGGVLILKTNIPVYGIVLIFFLTTFVNFLIFLNLENWVYKLFKMDGAIKGSLKEPIIKEYTNSGWSIVKPMA